MVYVLNKDGKPLMPTNRCGHVRKLLKSGKAIVVKRKPFTIKLTYDTPDCVQPISLGVDTGYTHVGVSAVTDTHEVYAAQVELLTGQKKRLDDRRKYRRTRRNRLRHRPPRFENRRRKSGWLPPSLQHKVDSHIRIVEGIKAILPITEVHFEIGNFDTHKMKKPSIRPWQYTEGEMKGFDSVKEYVKNRDNYTCQLCGKQHKDGKGLVVHHFLYWKGRRSNNPNEMVTLCDTCNSVANHEKSGPLWGWEPKQLRQLQQATFMNALAVRLMTVYPDADFMYGELTAQRREEYNIPKSHTNDAFIIAGGKSQLRFDFPFNVEQRRRNNRSLEKFYDAKYIDSRDGSKQPGKVLSSIRVKRKTPPKDSGFRQFRQSKVSKGKRYIRKKRYFYQPGDLVVTPLGKAVVKGTICSGNSMQFYTLSRTFAPSKVKPIKFGKGFCFQTQL